MRKIFLMCIMLSFLIIAACKSNDSGTTLVEESSTSFMVNTVSNSIVDENSHYRIYQIDSGYYYEIYNQNQEIIYTSMCGKRPEIEMISKEVLRVSSQAGTGLSTAWNIYFNISTNKHSDTYYYVLSDTYDKVVCFDGEKIIVQDIFDKSVFYAEISRFDKELSMCIEPIISCQLIDDKYIKIVYLAGDNYDKTTQTIEITT